MPFSPYEKIGQIYYLLTFKLSCHPRCFQQEHLLPDETSTPPGKPSLQSHQLTTSAAASGASPDPDPDPKGVPAQLFLLPNCRHPIPAQSFPALVS